MPTRKLLYTFWVICLLATTILLIVTSKKSSKTYTVLKFNLPRDEKPSEYEAIFSKYYFYNEIKNKKVITVQLNLDTTNKLNEDYLYKQKLELIENEVKRLQFTNDTSSILKIELFNNCTYGDFVYLTNLAVKYKYKRYLFADDCFYYKPNKLGDRLYAEKENVFYKGDTAYYSHPHYVDY